MAGLLVAFGPVASYVNPSILPDAPSTFPTKVIQYKYAIAPAQRCGPFPLCIESSIEFLVWGLTKGLRTPRSRSRKTV